MREPSLAGFPLPLQPRLPADLREKLPHASENPPLEQDKLSGSDVGRETDQLLDQTGLAPNSG